MIVNMMENVKKTSDKSEVKEESKKLSYEELENVCHQLSEQARTLYQQLQKATTAEAFKRLDYLFKIVENSVVFGNNEEFYNECVNEIVASLRIPKETEE